MITIHVTPAKQRFGLRKPRKQWQYLIVAANHEPISEKDSYANPGDITDIMRELIASDEPVQVVTHYLRGDVTERIR